MIFVFTDMVTATNAFGRIINLNDENKILFNIKKIEECVRNLRLSGNMLSDDVVLLDNMNKTLRTLKKEYVDKLHVTEAGIPRKIEQKEYGRNKELVWVTYLPGQKRIKCTTLGKLYDKLFEYYSIGGESCETIGSVFKAAIKQKKLMKGINESCKGSVSVQNTIKRNMQDFNRFVSPELAKTKILLVTPLFIKEYTIKMLNEVIKKEGKKLKKKAFINNYKGILNLIFDYAEEHDICPNFIRNPNKFKNSDYYALLDSSKKKAEKKAFSPDEMDKIENEADFRIDKAEKEGKFYTDGYMLKLSRRSGMRVAEISSLMKCDLNFEYKFIHVHSQQLKNKDTLVYEYVDYTKNERGVSDDGRLIPMLPETERILRKALEWQEQNGIESEWVFCDENGDWIKNDSQYMQFLKRLCRKLKIPITNNHAIRMYFNSYVMIPAGIPVTDRAKILGHSPEINLKNYSFEDRSYCSKSAEKLQLFLSGDGCGRSNE